MFLTPRFFVLSAVVALLSAVGFFWSPLYTLALVLLALLAAALVLDAVFALLSLQCEGRREVDPRLSLGAENPVRLVVRNTSRLTARILPLDELPEDMASSPLPDRHMALRPGQTKELTYRLRPDRRGHFAFGNFYVFARTVIGFWERRLLICGSTEVKVYPEFRHLSEREAQYRLKNDVQVGKRLVHLEGLHLSKGGENGDCGDEERTGKREVGHHAIDIVGGFLTWLNTGNKTIVALHVFGHLHGIHSDCRVEIGECYNEEDKHDIVENTVGIEELLKYGALRLGDIDKHQGYEHDGLSKNDRHHIGREKLEGNVLTSTAHLILSSFNSFSVLYGYLAYCLYQKNGERHDTNQSKQLNEELDESTAFGAGKCRSELFDESHGETRDDTNHNDDGNTVADSAIGDAFTEPQHEHRTGCENNG